MDTKRISKEEIIAEYLTGKISYRAMGEKYGIPYRKICYWVMGYQGRNTSWEERKLKDVEKEKVLINRDSSKEVALLQRALRKSELKNELLEEMLKLSESHTGIALRKKFGSKQS